MSSKISHIQFMSLYKSGMNDREIADALSIHRVTIGEYRRKFNLPPNRKATKELTKEEKEKIIELYHQELNFKEIAEQLKRSHLTIARFCERQGLDTSKKRHYKFDRKRKFKNILKFLEKYGPTTQSELSKKLKISTANFPIFARECFDEVERFNFKRGQGKRHRLVVEIYGDLMECRNLFCLRNDERLIDFVTERIPMNPETEEEAKAILNHLKIQLGYDRARKVVEKLGYEYRTGPPDNFKMVKFRQGERGHGGKFTDEEFLKYYNEGLIDRKVAKILGVSSSAIVLRRKVLNLPPHGRSGRKKRLIQCPHCGKEFKL